MTEEDRNPKRIKVMNNIISSPVAPLSLVKLRPSIFSDRFPSPGFLQSTRVAAKHHDGSMQIYFTSAKSIYRYSMQHEKGSANNCIKGKEGMLLPTIAESKHPVVYFSKGVSELQSLSLSSDMTMQLGAIDSRGQIYCFDTHSSLPVSLLNPPKNIASQEEGWAGLSFGPLGQASGLAAASHHPGKYLALYRIGSSDPEHTWHMTMNPTALCWAGEGNALVAVAEEGRGISLWDPRSPTPCQTVIQPHNSSSSETIHSLCWVSPVNGGFGSSGLLASAGTDRTVQLYEPRKWQTAGRWGGSAKYAITGAVFSSVNPRYCYLQSLDYELTCGRWETSASSASGPVRGNTNSASGGHGRAVGPSLKVHPAVSKSSACVSFRGDSRWLGLAIVQGQETNEEESIVSYSQAGSIFIYTSSFPNQ